MNNEVAVIRNVSLINARYKLASKEGNPPYRTNSFPYTTTSSGTTDNIYYTVKTRE